MHRSGLVIPTPKSSQVLTGPCCFLLAQVKDLLLPFGVLKAFNLVMDKNTGNSKVQPEYQSLSPCKQLHCRCSAWHGAHITTSASCRVCSLLSLYTKSFPALTQRPVVLEVGRSLCRQLANLNPWPAIVQGYAFCEYADTALTNYVIQALNGKPVGNKFLTVKRALAPAPTSPFDPQLG